MTESRSILLGSKCSRWKKRPKRPGTELPLIFKGVSQGLINYTKSFLKARGGQVGSAVRWQGQQGHALGGSKGQTRPKETRFSGNTFKGLKINCFIYATHLFDLLDFRNWFVVVNQTLDPSCENDIFLKDFLGI